MKDQRLETQKDGSTKPIAINEPLMIGLYTQAPQNLGKADKPLNLHPHQVTQKETKIKITVTQKPTYLAVVPYNTRPDEKPEDNGGVFLEGGDRIVC